MRAWYCHHSSNQVFAYPTCNNGDCSENLPSVPCTPVLASYQFTGSHRVGYWPEELRGRAPDHWISQIKYCKYQNIFQWFRTPQILTAKSLRCSIIVIPSNQRQKKRDAEEADKVEVAPGVTVASLRRFRTALIGPTQGLPKRRRLCR